MTRPPLTRTQMASLSLMTAAVLYAAFLFSSDGTALMHSAGRIGGGGAAVILSLSLFNYALRFGRWHLYLTHLQHKVPPLRGFEYYVAGFSLTATPGKVGEAVRAFYLKQHQVPYRDTLAMLFAERLSDVLAMVALSCLAAWQFPQYRLLIALTLAVVAVVILMLQTRAALAILQHQSTRLRLRRTGRIVDKILTLLVSARRLLSARMLFLGLILSLVSWAAEGLGLYLILQFLHVQVSAWLAVGVYAVSILIGALSFLPGGLGSTEAAMVLLLMVLGADRHTALSATLICRAATLWFAIIIGMLALLDLQHRLPAPRPDETPLPPAGPAA